MKLNARLHRGPEVQEHTLELLASDAINGPRTFAVDGRFVEAHCEEITPGVYSVLLAGRSYEAHISQRPGDRPGLASPFVVEVGLRRYLVELRDPRRLRQAASSLELEGPQEILAPMPGTVVRILAKQDQQVERHEGLLIIEAMKMQNELRAPRAGRVERIFVAEGQG